MKIKHVLLISAASLALACGRGSDAATEGTSGGAEIGPGQSGVIDETSDPNVVVIAANSPDHKTLVAAVTHAELLDALSNAGPFTVFAPTDAAFAALPEGTVPPVRRRLTEVLEGRPPDEAW